MAALRSLDDVLAGELPPAPGGADLVLPIRCSTSGPLTGPFVAHELVIHADWSVGTVHDLEAERVAAAFGGYLTCLEYADRVLPAARRCVQARARRGLPAIRLEPLGTWTPRDHFGVCCASTFGLTRAEAAAHVRSGEHAAARYGVHLLQVEPVVRAVLNRHAMEFEPRLPADAEDIAGRCVNYGEDLAGLWDVGVPPALVRAIHVALGIGCRPMRPDFYLQVLSRDADLRWLNDHAFTVPDSVLGLPWPRIWPKRPIDEIAVGVRASWLVLGLPTHLIEDLDRAGYRPSDVQALSRATGRPPMGSASALGGWVAAGCRPSIGQVIALHASGVTPFYRPSKPSIRRACDALAGSLPQASITDIGLLLAVTGSVPLAIRWGLAGFADFGVVARLITDDRPVPASKTVAIQGNAGQLSAHAS
ncbi:MAG: hypothetical protein ABI912_09795 [Actinomycetota bacterium]